MHKNHHICLHIIVVSATLIRHANYYLVPTQPLIGRMAVMMLFWFEHTNVILSLRPAD